MSIEWAYMSRKIMRSTSTISMKLHFDVADTEISASIALAAYMDELPKFLIESVLILNYLLRGKRREVFLRLWGSLSALTHHEYACEYAYEQSQGVRWWAI